MQNFLMMLAATGLFYTALNSALYDMTLSACENKLTNYELACKQVNKRELNVLAEVNGYK